MYRWFVHDPIHFAKSLRWTVEHGHANNFSNNYASVAYWYQTPNASLPTLPGAEEMLPSLGEGYEEARDLMTRTAISAFASGDALSFFEICRAAAPFYRGDWPGTIDALHRYQ